MRAAATAVGPGIPRETDVLFQKVEQDVGVASPAVSSASRAVLCSRCAFARPPFCATIWHEKAISLA
ncbi:hypothetical protein Bequi_06130 [Brachybacterium sp. JHP9]|uniref:Uncharacterized protein n=1 Tax=Brachybacterium equifaecis TaxID=2910770 RepID=A0ABT0QZ85_9MICO|nr:hypothetical protein [Brachybacterium equifaecis]